MRRLIVLFILGVVAIPQAVNGSTAEVGKCLYSELWSAPIANDGLDAAMFRHGSTVDVWSNDGQLISRLEIMGHSGGGPEGGSLSKVQLSPDQSKVLTFGDKNAIVWDAKTGRVLHRHSHRDLDAAAMSPDGKTIALAAPSGKTYIVDSETGNMIGL